MAQLITAEGVKRKQRANGGGFTEDQKKVKQRWLHGGLRTELECKEREEVCESGRENVSKPEGKSSVNRSRKISMTKETNRRLA